MWLTRRLLLHICSLVGWLLAAQEACRTGFCREHCRSRRCSCRDVVSDRNNGPPRPAPPPAPPLVPDTCREPSCSDRVLRGCVFVHITVVLALAISLAVVAAPLCPHHVDVPHALSRCSVVVMRFVMLLLPLCDALGIVSCIAPVLGVVVVGRCCPPQRPQCLLHRVFVVVGAVGIGWRLLAILATVAILAQASPRRALSSQL